MHRRRMPIETPIQTSVTKEVERLTRLMIPNDGHMRTESIIKKNHSIVDSLSECEIQDSKVLKKMLDELKQIAAALVEEVEGISHLPALKLKLDHGIDLPEEIREFERYFIESALKQTLGHQTKAAELLGLKLTTLNHKLKRLGISTDRIHGTRWKRLDDK